MKPTVVDGKLQRYYEQLVGALAADNRDELPMTNDYVASDSGSAKVQISVDGGETWNPPMDLAHSTYKTNPTLAANTDLMSALIKVTNTETAAGHDVTYEAEYLLRIYRRSNNADLQSVVLTYDNMGETGLKQNGLMLKKDDGSFDKNKYVLYVPADVDVGDLTFTTSSEGARIGLSTKPIDVNVSASIPAPSSMTRNVATLKEAGVAEGNTVYAYVQSSNNLRVEVYELTIHTVDLGLGKLTSAAPDKQQDNKVVTDDQALTDSSRKDTVTLDEKTYIHYVTYVPDDNADHTDALVADLVAAGKTGAEVNVKVEAITASATVAPAAEGFQWTGAVDTAVNQADTRLKITVSATPYAAKQDDTDTINKSNAVERVYIVDVFRKDSDTTLGEATYTWSEPAVRDGTATTYTKIEDLTETALAANESKLPGESAVTNALPEYFFTTVKETETDYVFTVDLTANSSGAKVAAQLWTKATSEFKTNSVDFSDAENTFHGTFTMPKNGDDTASHVWLAVTVLASGEGFRATHFYDMERVLKTVAKAGVTPAAGSGDSSLSDVAEVKDIDNDGKDERVIVAVADPETLKDGETVSITAVLESAKARGQIAAWGTTNFTPTDLGKTTNTVTLVVTDAGAFYIPVGIHGVEVQNPVDGYSPKALNVEYVQLVEWSDNDNLESVTVTYVLDGVTYTAPAYRTAGTDQYVVYLPNTVKQVESITAVTEDRYANVRVKDDEYVRHTATHGAEALAENADTTVPIDVLASANYYLQDHQDRRL